MGRREDCRANGFRAMGNRPLLLVHSTLVIGLSAVACNCLAEELTVSATQQLGFGRWLNDLAVGSETVSFTNDGNAANSGSDVIQVGGITQPARFAVSGSCTGLVDCVFDVLGGTATGQSITISAAPLVHSVNTSQTLPWRWLKADYDGSTVRESQTQGASLVITLTDVSVYTTTETLRVFGGIEMEAGDTAGAYVGTVTVTAIYQ